MDRNSSGSTERLGTIDTTVDFLKNFSVIDWESYESENPDEGEFEELSPIPESPGDLLDSGAAPAPPPVSPGSVCGKRKKLELDTDSGIHWK